MITQMHRHINFIKQSVILIFAAVLLLVSLALQAKPSKIEFSRELGALTQALESVHPNPWRVLPKQAFRDRLTKNPNLLDGYPFSPWFTISRALNALDRNNQDTVTGINLLRQSRTWKRLPLTFARFEEGVFIIAAEVPFNAYIGQQVLEINGKSAIRLFNQIATNFPRRDLDWIPHYLRITELLGYYGARCQNTCQLTLASEEQQSMLSLERTDLIQDKNAQMAATPINIKNYFSQNNPEQTAVDMMDPQSLRWDMSGKMLKSTLMYEEHEATVLRLLNNQRLTNIVLDIRSISQIDRALIERFIRIVRAIPEQNPDRTLYVLIDRSTQPLVYELVARLADMPEVKFIGQKPETQLSHFYDAKPLTLGKTQLTISLATRFEKFLTTYPDQQYIRPLSIEWSAADYFAGEDTLLISVQDLIEINQ